MEILYIEIKTKKNITELQQSYGSFHDSVITEVHFKTGNNVDDSYMNFGDEQDYELHMFLSRQWKPKHIELVFSGVKKISLAGYQNYYSPEIYGCNLEIYTDLIKSTLFNDEFGIYFYYATFCATCGYH